MVCMTTLMATSICLMLSEVSMLHYIARLGQSVWLGLSLLVSLAMEVSLCLWVLALALTLLIACHEGHPAWKNCPIATILQKVCVWQTEPNLEYHTLFSCTFFLNYSRLGYVRLGWFPSIKIGNCCGNTFYRSDALGVTQLTSSVHGRMIQLELIWKN